MHFVTGEIIEMYAEHNVPMARVSIQGAILRVPISLTPAAKVGDRLLIESGVAIAIESTPLSEERHNVSGNTG
jgi:hydrogenase maturation factor